MRVSICDVCRCGDLLHMARHTCYTANSTQQREASAELQHGTAGRCTSTSACPRASCMSMTCPPSSTQTSWTSPPSGTLSSTTTTSYLTVNAPQCRSHGSAAQQGNAPTAVLMLLGDVAARPSVMRSLSGAGANHDGSFICLPEVLHKHLTKSPVNTQDGEEAKVF